MLHIKKPPNLLAGVSAEPTDFHLGKIVCSSGPNIVNIHGRIRWPLKNKQTTQIISDTFSLPNTVATPFHKKTVNIFEHQHFQSPIGVGLKGKGNAKAGSGCGVGIAFATPSGAGAAMPQRTGCDDGRAAATGVGPWGQRALAREPHIAAEGQECIACEKGRHLHTKKCSATEYHAKTQALKKCTNKEIRHFGTTLLGRWTLALSFCDAVRISAQR